MQSIFGFIIHPMELGLIWLASLVGSAGVGIILFTIFVRLVLAPLTITQLRNAKSMQRIQPLVKELQQKHGKDRVALQQATMELYREHNVNPAMGCLPTLLQFPILIGLFYALLHLGSSPDGYQKGAINWAKSACNGHTVSNLPQWLHSCYTGSGWPHDTLHVFNLFHANFLWLNHGLGSPDPLFILPVLAGVTQWIQSRMMLTRSNDPQQQMMNTMMNFLPLMIVFFALRYPSGLSLYWVTSTSIGILIQYRITGWGLLSKEGIPGLSALFGSPAARQAVNRPSGQKRPSAGARPKSSGNGQNGKTASSASSAPKEASLGAVPAEQDGQNGMDGDRPPAAPVSRPRKKANRARGGRGGGRRG